MDFIRDGAQHVKVGIAYLQENAWYIVVMLGVWYYVKTNRKFAEFLRIDYDPVCSTTAMVSRSNRD